MTSHTLAATPAYTATIMVFGDSLSASYGLPAEAGWVNLLRQKLKTEYPAYQVINTSISGETTLGGRNRIQKALAEHQPDIVILELGANDGLRGASIKSIYDNLEAIIKASQQNNAGVLLVGMRLPPNYGIGYTKKFYNLFSRLAEHHQTALVPFLMAGFGDKPEFFQHDRIHPNGQAQTLILNNIWPTLQTMLK